MAKVVKAAVQHSPSARVTSVPTTKRPERRAKPSRIATSTNETRPATATSRMALWTSSRPRITDPVSRAVTSPSAKAGESAIACRAAASARGAGVERAVIDSGLGEDQQAAPGGVRIHPGHQPFPGQRSAASRGLGFQDLAQRGEDRIGFTPVRQILGDAVGEFAQHGEQAAQRRIPGQTGQQRLRQAQPVQKVLQRVGITEHEAAGDEDRVVRRIEYGVEGIGALAEPAGQVRRRRRHPIRVVAFDDDHEHVGDLRKFGGEFGHSLARRQIVGQHGVGVAVDFEIGKRVDQRTTGTENGGDQHRHGEAARLLDPGGH